MRPGFSTVGDARALGRVNDHAKLAGERGLTGDGYSSSKDIVSQAGLGSFCSRSV